MLHACAVYGNNRPKKLQVSEKTLKKKKERIWPQKLTQTSACLLSRCRITQGGSAHRDSTSPAKQRKKTVYPSADTVYFIFIAHTLLVGRHLGQLSLVLVYLSLLARWMALGSTPREGRKVGVETAAGNRGSWIGHYNS